MLLWGWTAAWPKVRPAISATAMMIISKALLTDCITSCSNMRLRLLKPRLPGTINMMPGNNMTRAGFFIRRAKILLVRPILNPPIKTPSSSPNNSLPNLALDTPMKAARITHGASSFLALNKIAKAIPAIKVANQI